MNRTAWFSPRKLCLLGALVGTALLAVVPATAHNNSGDGTQGNPYGPGDHVPICHATGSESHPYEYIEPSAASGGPAGHGGHSGDIFAGYWFKQNQNAAAVFVNGRNEDMLDLLGNDCVKTPPPHDECPLIPGDQPEGTECEEPELVWVCTAEGVVVQVPVEDADSPEFHPTDPPNDPEGHCSNGDDDDPDDPEEPEDPEDPVTPLAPPTSDVELPHTL